MMKEVLDSYIALTKKSTSIILIILGALIILNKERIEESFNLSITGISIVGFLSVMVGAMMVSYQYLRENDITNENNKRLNKYVIKKIGDLEATVNLLKAKNPESLTDFEKQIDVIIEKKFSERNPSLNVLNQGPSLTAGSASDRRIFRIHHQISNSQSRFREELNKLDKRADFDLAFGTIATFSAIVMISIEVVTTELNFQQLIPLLSHFIPRITLVIFIEIFAFFFLKKYKSALVEKKFLHNELTNLETKYLAVHLALRSDDNEFQKEVIDALLATERNFILKKDESTVELNKQLIESNSNNKIVEALTKILAKK